MISETFDFILQCGGTYQTSFYPAKNCLQAEVLQNIQYSGSDFKDNKISLHCLSSQADKVAYFETDKIVLVKLGKCFPTLAYACATDSSSEIFEEQLTAMYLRLNNDIADCIKGVFTLVIYDKEKSRIFALSGKSGLYKLHYFHSRGMLLLSSSLDSIARHPVFTAEFNPVALIEQLNFGYPLGKLTLFENVLILDNHSYLSYQLDNEELKVIQYYSFRDKLSETPRLDWAETYRQTPKVFYDIMQQYIIDGCKVNAALTSGFDSRTILSATAQHKEQIQYFSYGISNRSDDVRIPQLIASKLGLNYKWIQFSEAFFKDYDFYANQLLHYTDGSGNLKRCNQMYSQSLLTDFSGTTITGCMGSELLRPNNMMSTNILPKMVKLIYQRRSNTDNISAVLAECPAMLQPGYFSKHREETIQHIKENLSNVMIYDEAYLNLYHFTIRYSLWKFFGQEFHASRIYTTLLSPYADDDFIEFVLKTPVPALNKHAFRRNASDLRMGQKFYTPILQQNLPELMRIETGRGYTPAQLESILFPANIIIPYSLRRINNALFRKAAAFNASEWNKISYKAHPKVFSHEDNIFTQLDSDIVNDSEYSLKKWAMGYL
jgi:hypothetical protein